MRCLNPAKNWEPLEAWGPVFGEDFQGVDPQKTNQMVTVSVFF